MNIINDLKWSNLQEYMYRKTIYYENDIQQLSNNVVYRRADALDHLEMIMAQVRLDTSIQIFNDIYKIMTGFKNYGTMDKRK